MKSRIINADAFDALDDLDKNSVHAVVTDPPYGLAFMGRSWDDFEPKEYQEWCEKWTRKAMRVLKPGGHLLAFSGNRTHHRLFTGVEDAGFEVRDTLTWHYGSGFPKASDISKTIDKRADAEREVVGTYKTPATGKEHGYEDSGTTSYKEHKDTACSDLSITAPATEAAKKCDGFKTGLKPSTEFVVMARKPYDGATVDCVLEHGTGALNIDGCRIGHDEECKTISAQQAGDKVYSQAGRREETLELKPEGRYPSNLMFDEVAAEQLDADVGESNSNIREPAGPNDTHGFGASDRDYGDNPDEYDGNYERGFDDSGGPSRYFYTSKASRSERTLDGKIDNAHPTVKPGDLMQWLVKLVTAENQIVLDPFAGSGTTLRAAKDLNRQFIGIERQPKWADVARVRAGLTPDDPSTVRDDADQSGLEAYE